MCMQWQQQQINLLKTIQEIYGPTYQPMMKSPYIDYSTRGIVELIPDQVMTVRGYEDALWVSRINVPWCYRKSGVGSKLLDQVCSDANAAKTILVLTILESDGLTYQQLREWYERRGFEEEAVGSGIFVRRPKESACI